jgi:hypothetical protein
MRDIACTIPRSRPLRFPAPRRPRRAGRGNAGHADALREARHRHAEMEFVAIRENLRRKS